MDRPNTKRVNTLTIAPENARKPSPEEVCAWLEENGVSVDDVLVVQEEFGTERVHVKLLSAVKFEKIAERPVRGMEIGGENRIVFLTKNGATARRVTIKGLPTELHRASVNMELERYGRVLEHRLGRFTHGPWVGKGNGERKLLMALDYHVPSFIVVEGCEGAVMYRGQPRTCRRCDSRSHVVARCPNQAEEEEGEEGGAEDSDDVTRRAFSEPPSSSVVPKQKTPERGAGGTAGQQPAEQQEQTTQPESARGSDGDAGVEEEGEEVSPASEPQQTTPPSQEEARGIAGVEEEVGEPSLTGASPLKQKTLPSQEEARGSAAAEEMERDGESTRSSDGEEGGEAETEDGTAEFRKTFLKLGKMVEESNNMKGRAGRSKKRGAEGSPEEDGSRRTRTRSKNK